MRGLYLVGGVTALAVALFVFWGSTHTDQRRTLTLTGSSTIAPLIQEIGRRYESRFKDVRVDVQSGGSSRGVADARRGVSDIGMVSRRLKPSESDLYAFAIGYDGVSVIVHRNNPITRLSNEQIIDIYTKRITNWKALGGRDASIVVVNKAEGRSTLEVFLKYFKLRNAQIKADSVIGDNEQGIKLVAGNPNAIGYVSIGTATFDIAHGIPIKLLPIAGVAATVDNLRNGRFPIRRQLTLVTRKPPTGGLKRFIAFARSTQVRDLVRKLGFVPVSH